jgi:hypothetical protein
MDLTGRAVGNDNTVAIAFGGNTDPGTFTPAVQQNLGMVRVGQTGSNDFNTGTN